MRVARSGMGKTTISEFGRMPTLQMPLVVCAHDHTKTTVLPTLGPPLTYFLFSIILLPQ